MCFVLIQLVHCTVIKCCCVRWEISMSLQWGLTGKLWGAVLIYCENLSRHTQKQWTGLGSTACVVGAGKHSWNTLWNAPPALAPHSASLSNSCSFWAVFERLHRSCNMGKVVTDSAGSPLSLKCPTAWLWGHSCCSGPSLLGHGLPGTQPCFVPCWH